MIECPNCKASLPDWSKACQFCQADTAQVLRPKQQTPNVNSFTIPAWIWTAYYSVSALLLINSGIGIWTTVASVPKYGFGLFDYVSLAFDGFGVLVSIGLLFRIELIRGVMNIICFLGILSGLKLLAAGVFGSIISTWALLFAVYGAIKVILYGFMIYLIGETDKAIY
jgi:hypothetical protein